MIIEATPYCITPGRLDQANTNPCGQSVLRLIDNNRAMIVRPLVGRHDIPPRKEIALRQRAYNYYNRRLPDYTLPSWFVASDGTYTEKPEATTGTDTQKTGALLMRYSEKLNNVKPLTSMKREEILEDAGLTRDLSKIYGGFAKMVLIDGVTPDAGSCGDFDKGLPGCVKKLAKHMSTDNIMLGEDSNGNRKVFVDPDWVCEYSSIGKLKRIKNTLVYGGFFTLSSAIYQASSLLQRTRQEMQKRNNFFETLKRKTHNANGRIAVK